MPIRELTAADAQWAAGLMEQRRQQYERRLGLVPGLPGTVGGRVYGEQTSKSGMS